MHLRDLECFIAVATELHFGRAAERLHLAQPTVSDTVRRLERELGGVLLARTTRSVTLTPLGERFLVEAEAAYEHVRRTYDLGRRLASHGTDELTVGYGADARDLVMSTIQVLHEQYPELTVRVEAAGAGEQLAALRHHTLDTGICLAPEVDEDFNARVVTSHGFVALVPAGHRLAARDALVMADLVGEPLIGWQRLLNPVLHDRLGAALEGAGAARPDGIAVGYDNVTSLVLCNRGIGVMPLVTAVTRPTDGLRVIPVADAPRAEQVVMWRKALRHDALDTFVDMLCRIAAGSPHAAGAAPAGDAVAAAS